MKNLILTVFTLFISSLFLNAQDTNKKNIILGGTLGFNYSKSISGGNGQMVIAPNRGEFTETSFSINPYIGKYLSNKFILGIDAGYAIDVLKIPFSNRDDKATNHAYTVGIFGRYLINPDQKLIFQIEPSAIFQYTSIGSFSSFPSINDRDKIVVGGFLATPILSYSISPKINLIGRFGSLQFLVGYWQLSGSNDKNDFSQFGLLLDSTTISFGVEANL
ncbi:MAG: hypothetical protein R2825_05230 [Saprospiraceae bacterium]